MPAPIYLDHAATTPLRPDVLEAMQPFFGPRFGNPSSTHRWGREARVALDEARGRLARCLGAHDDEIVFTAGGTEGDNLAVLGGWRHRRADGRSAVVVSAIEHKAVLGAAHAAAAEGAEERIVPVTPDGVVTDEEFARALDRRVALCSVMWVNNEIGSIQPVRRLAALAHECGALFHTDAVQALGKLPMDMRQDGVDLLTVSGHKIGAPKGVGALVVRRGTRLTPLAYGGSQERARRPGTENVAFAVGLARAAELAVAERDASAAHLRRLREMLETAITAGVPDAVIHGRSADRAPHILSVSAPGVDSESLLMALDLAGVACSGGSACLSGGDAPSHVLTALGMSRELAAGAVRMSLGALTTAELVARAAAQYSALVAKARRYAAMTS